MADELKTVLSNVVASKGSKHFFFLYGTGKRNDGKGDGGLVVAAIKPKRTQAEEKCECKEVFEGECWSSPDGKLIYFEGKAKKLAKPLLDKITKSIKAETGKDYKLALVDDAGPVPSTSAPATPAAAAPAKKVTFDESSFHKVWPVVTKTWQTASDKVDRQLTELIKAMKADDDPEMKEIADKGLNAVAGNFKVPLLAAIRSIDGASGETLQKAVAKARGIVTEFRNHLNSDKRVAVCEDNPWDVSVTIRADLGKALEMMGKALQAVAQS